MSFEDIDHRFKHHAPSPQRAARHARCRQDCKELAVALEQTLPPGREKSLALTKLEETMFWANAAIAREQGDH